MSSLQFSFPPESYSAVYTSDGAAPNANIPVNCSVCEVHEISRSVGEEGTRVSLFSCFNCAFRNSIKVIRKEKHKKELNRAKNKAFNTRRVVCERCRVGWFESDKRARGSRCRRWQRLIAVV
ncbi:uncharacterized protein LOC114248723 [Bombyx mandarina]|uniref:Uncharacterized protein LOC114248723 n=1 Tax=Bombyx mandarina TaxID=7092 RepID=A0A6J2KAE3_BOMMA|nr:uncharacterized protein LOC114248723 [Bombyx mandarina]